MRLNTVKNLTSEYGIEQEFIKQLHKKLLASGVKLYNREERADYNINIVVKNVTNAPLSYRHGINVTYVYEYEYSITVELELVDSTSSQIIRKFSISDEYIYFSADSPATTESNKRLAIVKILNRITERFVRELSFGI